MCCARSSSPDDDLAQHAVPLRADRPRGGRGRHRGRYTGNERPLADWLTGRERLDVSGVERVSADTPVPAGNLLDDHPGDRPHVLAFDLDHGIGHLAHDVLLLRRGEHSLDNLHIDERHWFTSSDALAGQRIWTAGLTTTRSMSVACGRMSLC